MYIINIIYIVLRRMSLKKGLLPKLLTQEENRNLCLRSHLLEPHVEPL